MKSIKVSLLLLILVTPLRAGMVTHPDQISCKDEHTPGRWHMDSVGDLEHDPPYYFIYWVYKWLNPIRETDCQVKEFFKRQDLCFGKNMPDIHEKPTTLRLAAAGDLMVKTHLDRKTARHLFDDVSNELASPDITFGNLESPVVPSSKVGAFPAYNATPEQVRLYKQAGFDIFSTANNHVLDQKDSGLIATLEFLDQEKIAHVGSSRTKEERDNMFPILEAKGLRIAFLAYTFSTNGRKTLPGNEYMVNHIPLNLIDEQPDISLIQKHIRTARSRGADLVAVSLHWGMEYEFFPPRRIIELAHNIADQGADIILGHHPHVLQPLEKYIPQRSDAGPVVPEVLIAYSLGNFIPDAYILECKTGIILDVEISRAEFKDRDQIWISRVTWTPVWFHKRRSMASREYRIININKALAKDCDPEIYPYLSERDCRKIYAAHEIVRDLFEPLVHE
jgi:poly-gamma-glutamate capsule biosynthesis protein CapA/YwtB (metallophosphatase superfamily)